VCKHVSSARVERVVTRLTDDYIVPGERDAKAKVVVARAAGSQQFGLLSPMVPVRVYT
jgi:hypothetical protein